MDNGWRRCLGAMSLTNELFISKASKQLCWDVHCFPILLFLFVASLYYISLFGLVMLLLCYLPFCLLPFVILYPPVVTISKPHPKQYVLNTNEGHLKNLTDRVVAHRALCRKGVSSLTSSPILWMPFGPFGLPPAREGKRESAAIWQHLLNKNKLLSGWIYKLLSGWIRN